MSRFTRGRLRHRITLETWGVAQDPATGIVTEGWTPVGEVWAAIEPLSGREFIASQAEQSTISTRITIAWRDGLDPQMRVRHATAQGDVLYDVHAVLPDPDSLREWVTLMCSTIDEPEAAVP